MTTKSLDLENYFPYLLKTISEYISQGTQNKEYNGYTVGMREWRVLSLLAQYDRVSAKDVTLYSGMDKGTVSRAINRLKESDLIDIRPDPENWRFQKLSLTKQGEATYRAIAAEKVVRARKMGKGLTEQEHKQLIALLKKLRLSVLDALDLEVPSLSSKSEPSTPMRKRAAKK